MIPTIDKKRVPVNSTLCRNYVFIRYLVIHIPAKAFPYDMRIGHLVQIYLTENHLRKVQIDVTGVYGCGIA
jgi:hypothetical protein